LTVSCKTGPEENFPVPTNKRDEKHSSPICKVSFSIFKKNV